MTATLAKERRTTRIAGGGKPEDPYNVPPADLFVGEFLPATDLEKLAKQIITADRPATPAAAGGLGVLTHLDGPPAPGETKINIVYLWKKKGGQKPGCGALGKCTKPTGMMRYFSEADFVIWLAADHFRASTLAGSTGLFGAIGATRLQVEACLYHELKHTGYDAEASPPRPIVVPHDFTGFNDEVRLYGAWDAALEGARGAFQEIAG